VNRIRVLLVDENDDFLRGLSDWLVSEPGVDVVGVAMSGAEALMLAAALQPDLVLVDAGMHEPNGFELTRRLKALPEPPRVILESFHDNQTVRLEAARVGADGFVGKAAIAGELLPLLEERESPSTRPPGITGTRPENTREHPARLERKDRRQT
jgi:DNA-binding NarL/FixJ family response regulator